MKRQHVEVRHDLKNIFLSHCHIVAIAPVNVPVDALYLMDTVVPSYRINSQSQSPKTPQHHNSHSPSRPLRMIPLSISIPSIRMNQRRKRAPINHQPGNKRSELRWREEVDFEHCYGVGTYGFVPELVDAEFGDFFGLSGVDLIEESWDEVRTFSPDTFVQFFGVLSLGFVALEEVDVDVETASFVVCDG